MKNNGNKKGNGAENRNDSEYEALVDSEGKKINSVSHDSREPRKQFQDVLRMKILEERQKQNSMKTIFDVLKTPLQPKYSVSVLTLTVILFIGFYASTVSDEKNLVDQLTYVVSEKIDDWQIGITTEEITKKITQVFQPKEKIDDWQYAVHTGEEKSLFKSVSQAIQSPLSGVRNFAATGAADNIGFAVGGANDVNNFRENIKNDFLPLPTDITFEGLFYDYFFDTGQQEACSSLFCPSYSIAVSADPISGETEYFLSVGLNSGIQESDFARKKLNLVVVLDISGSMGAAFNKYYYDRFGRQVEVEEENFQKSKMEVANESVVALLDHLSDDDRFGMVLFNNNAQLAKPLRAVGETDMEAIANHVLEIVENGGTNMAAGMKMGTELFDELHEENQSEYENRIIFLTDAMPNLGATDKNSLLGITERNSGNKLYSTFIGIGVDFNTELVEAITKIRGANYYSVHSSKEFTNRMDEEFELMVTPLVFDLTLTLDADGYEIEEVYGSPEANQATGQIMKVNTLFPSSTEEGETRGGLVLLKLRKISSDTDLTLRVNYEDREGKSVSNESAITISESAEYFDNTGVRKGVLLSRYANLMKNWIHDERAYYPNSEIMNPCITLQDGLIAPCPTRLGQWERQSIALQVSDAYEKFIMDFQNYFEEEASIIGDPTLEQEVKLMEKLIAY